MYKKDVDLYGQVEVETMAFWEKRRSGAILAWGALFEFGGIVDDQMFVQKV